MLGVGTAICPCGAVRPRADRCGHRLARHCRLWRRRTAEALRRGDDLSAHRIHIGETPTLVVVGEQDRITPPSAMNGESPPCDDRDAGRYRTYREWAMASPRHRHSADGWISGAITFSEKSMTTRTERAGLPFRSRGDTHGRQHHRLRRRRRLRALHGALEPRDRRKFLDWLARHRARAGSTSAAAPARSAS